MENYDRAKSVALQFIQHAEKSQSSEEELKGRLFLVDLIKMRGFANDLSLYRYQLNKLSDLLPVERPDMKPVAVVLDLARSELAIAERRPDDAYKHASNALELARSQADNLVPSALLLRGLSLTIELFDNFNVSKDDKKTREAYEDLNRGLEGWVHPAFEANKVDAQLALAALSLIRGDQETARQFFEKANPPSSASAGVRANYQILKGQYVAVSNKLLARKFLDEAMALLQQETSPIIKAHALIQATSLAINIGHRELATPYFQEALTLVQNDPDHLIYLAMRLQKDIIPLLERWDLVLEAEGMFEKTIDALGLIKLPDGFRLLPLYAQLAKCYAKTFSIQKLEGVLAKASARSQTEPDYASLQDIYFSYASLGPHFVPARVSAVSRLAIGLSDKDSALIWDGLRRSIGLACEVGFYQNAVDYALIGLAFAAPILEGDPHDTIIEFLIEAGDAMTTLGRFDLASDAYHLASNRISKSTHRYWDERLQLGFAALFALIGDERAAKSFLDRVNLPRERNREIERRRWALFSTYGNVWADLENFVQAETAFEMCIDYTTTQVRDLDGEATCRSNLSDLLLKLGDAEGSYKQTIKAYEAVLEKKQFSLFFYDLHVIRTTQLFMAGYKADTFQSSQQGVNDLNKLPETARVLAYKAFFLGVMIASDSSSSVQENQVRILRSILQKIANEPYISVREVRVLASLNNVLTTANKDTLAMEVLSHLAGRLEYARSLLTDRVNRQAFGAAISGLFDQLSGLYLRQGTPDDIKKAFAIHEANRSRSVTDMKGIVPSREKAESYPLDSKGDDTASARQSLERIWKEPEGPFSRKSTETASQFLDNLLKPTSSGKDNKSSIIVPQFKLPKLISLEEIQASFPKDVALISYYITPDMCGAWIITGDEIRWKPLTSARNIEKVVGDYRSGIMSFQGRLNERSVEASKDAYAVLFGPLADAFSDKHTLVIVPDKFLYALPFESLINPTSNKYTIESHNIVYQLSLNSFLLSQSQNDISPSTTRKALIVGNPFTVDASLVDGQASMNDLENVWAELDDISQSIGSNESNVLYGQEATKEKFISTASQHSIIHIASHADANERNPYLSHIKLFGKNGYLTLLDLGQLTLSANLVVLSACETGRGKLAGGEGVWGFQSGFLGAGAKNVVVSLWKVEDKATHDLMVRFYRALRPQFLRFSQALRTAKLQLIHSPEFNHPYFWAPFVIYGQADVP